MIWRLTYCNKEGIEARLDIIRGASTPVEVIEGTETPFILNYKMDKPDKSGHVMSSSADISIFETPSFNIDNLKTSSETEIKVEHYINNVLDWSGFVIPDFFSKVIGTPATVEMVASDRLGTLKGVTLSGLAQYESMRDLVVKCLAKTGLSLPLYTLADFGNAGQTNAFFKALGLAGRLSDTKGRNISCYDILKSILVASNSKLVQQDGAWYIVNKFQHEQGAGNLFSTLTASTAYSEQTVNFSDVHVGARRSIVPVGATTGVFQEFGGGQEHPDNFDFSMGLSGWTNVNGFTATTRSEEVVGYELIGGVYQPIYGGYTSINHLVNLNPGPLSNPASPRYIKSADIPSPIEGAGSVKITASINATAYKAYPNMPVYVWYAVIAKKDGEVLALDLSGAFVPYVENQSVLERVLHRLSFKPGFTTVDFKAEVDTNADIITGELSADELSDYTFEVRIYGSGIGSTTLINFFSLNISSIKEQPRGSIFKRIQGDGLTKEHEIDTTIFGDYISRGLDGYFYPYAVDDTSSLYSSAGTLTEPLWTAHGDSEELPLLRHVTRQKSRMFSVAHNMISARIDVSTFKPLNIFVDCNAVNPRHVVVSATYDFLRSEVEVELEQIAYATLDVREYIYSYFGEGESGISSVGGISGGGTGTGGGGMTPEQIELLNTVAGYWQLDENGNLKTTYNAYSEQELSAYGIGSGGGGGGGAIATLSDVQLTGLTSGQILEYNGTHWINVAKPSGGGGGGSLVTWSNETTEKVTLTVEGIAKDLSKLGHTHAIANITGLQTQLNGKALNTININAGTGLTGGGNLTANRTLSLSATTIGQIADGVQAKQDIDNLEIGGRNLLISSSWWGAYLSFNTVPVVSNNGRTITFIKNNANGSTAIAKVSLPYKADGSIIYTFSGIAKADGEPVTNATWGASKTANTYQPTPLRFLLDDTSGRFEITQKWTVENQWILHGNIFPFPAGTVITIDDFQIEKGNKATDWTPAPEDTQQANWITSGVFDIARIPDLAISKITGLQTQLNGKALNTTNINAGAGLTGGGTLEANRTITLGTPSTLSASSPNGVTASSHTHAITTTSTGAANTIVQTNASGGTTFTGDLTAPKVIFSAAGWAMVQTGTELQMQYNGVAKMRFLNGGSIVAVEEITAYG